MLVVIVLAVIVATWPDSPLVVWTGVTAWTLIALLLALLVSATIAFVVLALSGTT